MFYLDHFVGFPVRDLVLIPVNDAIDRALVERHDVLIGKKMYRYNTH
jgi:hypothetical protein